MSSPHPLPPAAPDHERHDRLLVAQFVAGDPLAPEQQAEAQRLVHGCAACATLAAELPAVARAVAQEPVPPRRRDFRLGPEQAAALRGNPFTRFLRRLSLPSSRAFQPAAAGVLSIGLLLVVAAYAWPDGGTVSVQAEPNVIDWTSAAPTLAPAEAPAAVVTEDGPDDAAALEGAERAMEDEAFADNLLESQAGLSERPAQKSRAEADAPPAPERHALEPGEPGQAVPELEAMEEALGAAADEPAGDRSGGRLTEGSAEVAAEAADPAEAAEPAEPAAPAGADEGSASPASDSTAGTSDDGPVEVLVLLGLLLALGGGGLLLLGWLARRARDPLAP
jgi:hypothetical protein